MNVTLVSVRPTEAALAADRPALTPELLAASGARYSRNNEGLEAILSRIDPANLDRSVESIFRMIDYGHQSIADMAPVAMFMDGISNWLAYFVWSACSTAGGQESSTRYIRLSPEALPSAADLGIPAELAEEWSERMGLAFAAYEEALEFWEAMGTADPSVTRIPASLLQDSSDSAQKKVARMKRNYAFDRARYFLPAAVKTNVMLLMSARGWVQLCQQLLSHPLAEARGLGEAIREELRFATPRLLKHAEAKPSFVEGQRAEWETWRRVAQDSLPAALSGGNEPTDAAATPFLEVMAPAGAGGAAFARDLELHDNRYAWIGPDLRRTAVRFGWEAVAMAEIRDLNRHRTGTKYCPQVPQGFYAAMDELPAGTAGGERQQRLRALSEVGRTASRRAHELLAAGDPSCVYWTLLGTQFPFEHVTTADKFLYEAELRTGVGAHYRYARHLRDALALWYERFPETKGTVLEGSAEPE